MAGFQCDFSIFCLPSTYSTIHLLKLLLFDFNYKTYAKMFAGKGIRKHVRTTPKLEVGYVRAARGVFAAGHTLAGVDEHHVVVDQAGQLSHGGLQVFVSFCDPRLWDIGAEEGMREGVFVLQHAQSVAAD